MRPIAQQIIADIKKETCVKEMSLRCVFESRVATAGMLMHKNLLGRNNRARERGYSTPETCPILRALNAIKLAFRPGWIAVERLLQSPAYSGHVFDPEAGTAAVLRSQFLIIKNALWLQLRLVRTLHMA